jgi:hypothetical protein
MISYLEDNPIGKVLLAICGGLILVSMLLVVIWMLSPSDSLSDSEDENRLAGLELPELGVSEPLEEYAVITERPVFNESRLPVLELDEGDADEELESEDMEAPEIELAGVIITPTLRMATLRAKDIPNSLVAFEGRPLEGNFGSWQVSRIEAREVTLTSGDGEEMQLQLQIHDVKIAEPPKPEVPDREDEQQRERALAVADGDGDQPLSRAEEIRQRIAERREELRRAAEADEQNNSQKTSPQAVEKEQRSYQQAIQSMIGRKRQGESEDDEDQ